MLNRNKIKIDTRPIKILQIGAGNFSRAFIDFAIQLLNDKQLINSGIIIATSSSEKLPTLNQQNGLYTVVEGSKKGLLSTIIDSVQGQISIPDSFDTFLELAKNKEINVIVSNTTEVGITYEEEIKSHTVHSFPARLTLWLEERYKILKKDQALDNNLFILPCELIENNGTTLKKYIVQHAKNWSFSQEFFDWIENHVKFYDTLVDRIVSGFPYKQISDLQNEWTYQDNFAVLSEEFFFFAIKGDTDSLDKVLPFSKLSLDIKYTKDLDFYYRRKVYFLNGSHIIILGISILLNYSTVKESLNDPKVFTFLKNYLNNAHQAIGYSEETEKYINNVLNRFSNPYLEHKWNSILLNALSKFTVRITPVLLIMHSKNQDISQGLFSLSCLFVLYRKGIHNDSQYTLFKDISDSSDNTEDFVKKILMSKDIFNDSLPESWGSQISKYIIEIEQDFNNVLNKFVNQ